MNQLELAGVGRQFVILCAEREALVQKCQELQAKIDELSKPKE